MKKSNLPKNWIVQSSKSHPDKVFYFNTITKKALWELPVSESINESSSSKKNSKKRKKETDSEASRPNTPEMNQETERPVLQAKRRISLIPEKVSNETPQMREIREKLMQRQAKLNKGLKSNILPKTDSQNNQIKIKKSVDEESVAKVSKTKALNTKVANTKTPEVASIKEQDNNVPLVSTIKAKARFSTPGKPLPRKPGQRQSTAGSESSTETEAAKQTLTPQMRLLYDKIEQKKALKTGSSRKSFTSSAHSSSSSSTSSSSTSETSSSTSTSTSALSSQTSNKTFQQKEPLEPIKDTQNTATTRRKSRLLNSSLGVTSTSNLSTLIEKKDTELTQREKKLTPTTFSTRKSRRTICIPQPEIDKAEPDTTFRITSPYSATNCPKNLAKKRLDNLRKSFSLDELNESPVAKKRMSMGVEKNIQNTLDKSLDINSRAPIEDPGPEPSIYTNATARANDLRKRISDYQSCTADLNKSLRQKDLEAEIIENQPILDRLKDFKNDPYYEEMEWEPIEDEKIMSEVQAVRTQLYTKSINSVDVLQENILELSQEPVRKKALYIVVDTNVFLSNLQAVEEARDILFKSFGRPFIVIPWTVIKELDFIKDDKSATRSEALKMKARKAVRFLHQHFSTKHPRVLGQTPDDVAKNRELFSMDCPDDEILQSCLKIKSAGRSVVLLSYDKNLCNKAMIHDIVTLGRDDPFEKINYLNIDDSRKDILSVNHLSSNRDRLENTKTRFEGELLVAENIFEETIAVLGNFITPIVAREMENLYGEVWEKYTIIKPPWKPKDALKCAIKHWIAAVSESFSKRAESILKELLETISHPPTGGRKLKDVSYILERCNDLMQTLKQEKYPHLLNHMAAALNALRKRCLEESKKICEERIRNEIGHEENIARQDCRAEVALNYLNKVYSFTRDFCGTAAEAINMPCPFLFEKSDKRFSKHFVNNYQPMMAANLNHLLQILSIALEHTNGLQPDHKAIIALTDALTNYFPDEFNESNQELTSLDLYCLIKNKEDVMKRGLMQLQDLSQHFGRMASFRCR